jgi:hypothetical protein
MLGSAQRSLAKGEGPVCGIFATLSHPEAFITKSWEGVAAARSRVTAMLQSPFGLILPSHQNFQDIEYFGGKPSRGDSRSG